MKPPIIEVQKHHKEHHHCVPFEHVTLRVHHPKASRIVVRDGAGRMYIDTAVRPGAPLRFTVRGSAGRQQIDAHNARGSVVASATLLLKPHTTLHCTGGPYAALAERIARLMELYHETHSLKVGDRIYRMLICWTRDHVHTLKAWKYYMHEDRKSVV